MHLQFRPGPKLGVTAATTIKGKVFPLLIDTGAAGHDLDYSLIEKLKLPLGRTGAGSTPEGDIQTIDLGSIKVQVDGVNLLLDNAITVKDEPGGLIADLIFGLISPQRLASDKLVVVDLAEPALYLVSPIPTDVKAWLAKTFTSYDFDEVPLLEADPFVEMVVAETRPFGKISMTVDSGALKSYIYSDLKVDPTATVKIRINKHECLTQSAFIRPLNEPGHQNHLLGMDCLRGKVLAYLPPAHRSFFFGWPLK